MSNNLRSIHIRTLSGWRAWAAGGLLLAVLLALAFLAIGFFLLLLPVAIAGGIATLFLRKKRSVAVHHAPQSRPKVIETGYRVISEEKTHDDSRAPL